MHYLLNQYPLVSDQVNARELHVILRELESVLGAGIAGEVVEMGCYTGTTALFLQRLLLEKRSDKRLHLYDSFAGLPPKTDADRSPAGEQFRQGVLLATKAQLTKNFKAAHLPLPVIHKAWFRDLTADDIPAVLAFVFLDGDFYPSIMQSLRLVWPHLADGALVIIDDYQSEALPGARRAVDEWLINHQASLAVEASLAVIRPARQAT